MLKRILVPLSVVHCSNAFAIDSGLIRSTTNRTKRKEKLSSTCLSSKQLSQSVQKRTSNQWVLFSSEKDSPPNLPNTEDPFIILGISSPTADMKVIKRAYRRMALRYHPDVRINTNSTEKEKRIANDEFAKINTAYAILTGKSDASTSSSSAGKSTSTRSKSQRGKYSYTPPHRRSGQSTKSTYDWQDFMPNNEDEKYETDDSFSSIFSDLLSELGNSASGGKGGASILNDFVSFLEGNFPSVGNTQQEEEDIILNTLLKDGSYADIKNELDDAKLLVKQLEGKQRDLIKEMQDLAEQSNNFDQRTSYMDAMRLEERRKEIEARRGIVVEYLDRARVRQVKLKKRCDELRIQENFTSDEEQPKGERNNASSDDDAWKRESFGSSKRNRGTRSRSNKRPSSTWRKSSSSQRASTNTAYSTQSSYEARSKYSSNETTASNNRRSSTSSNSTGRSTSPSTSRVDNLPPHRRITSRFERNLEDKRRLKEIKVDEEIEKMKKELGL